MSSLMRLYGLLAPLGLYALGRGGLVDAELLSYGAAFGAVEEMIARLVRDTNPETAEVEALSLHEKAAGLPARPDAPEDSRRQLILKRKRKVRSGSKAELLNALEGCGLIGPFLEESGLTLRLSSLGIAEGLDPGDAFAMALRLLPAHLTVSAGNTWDLLDGAMPSWDALDAFGRSWDALALLGVSS